VSKQTKLVIFFVTKTDERYSITLWNEMTVPSCRSI